MAFFLQLYFEYESIFLCGIIWKQIKKNYLMKKLLKVIKVILLSITLVVVIISILNVSPFTFSKVKGVNSLEKQVVIH